jgi:hypothetical protein
MGGNEPDRDPLDRANGTRRRGDYRRCNSSAGRIAKKPPHRRTLPFRESGTLHPTQTRIPVSDRRCFSRLKRALTLRACAYRDSVSGQWPAVEKSCFNAKPYRTSVSAYHSDNRRESAQNAPADLSTHKGFVSGRMINRHSLARRYIPLSCNGLRLDSRIIGTAEHSELTFEAPIGYGRAHD